MEPFYSCIQLWRGKIL